MIADEYDVNNVCQVSSYQLGVEVLGEVVNCN